MATTSAPPAKKKGKAKPRLTTAEIAPLVLALLPAKQAEIAKQLGRQPSDGTVRRALAGLEKSGAAERVDGVWQRCQELPKLATPADFDAESIELHETTLKALQEQGTWRDHDIELLNDYVRRSQDARVFRAAVEADGRFTSSAGSRIFAHPGIDKERDARRDVQSLREALVLTPDARKKHGRDGDGDDAGDELDDF